jgi:hypothetical protein
MKNRFNILAVILTIGLVCGVCSISFPQPPPPPPEHGSGTNQAPGGPAPIGSGILLLVGFGAAYGSRKVYNASRKIKE